MIDGVVEINKTLIQSYVHHDGKCFFVSTIDRDSSAMAGGRFAETLVWEFDMATKARGNIVGQDGGARGSIAKHIAMCQRIFETGLCDEPGEAE